MSGLQTEPVEADHRRRRWLSPLYASALTATALVLPLCLLGNPSAHDLQPHLASWMDIHGQWREGIWFPRWAEWSNFGFGEPRFIFYPPSSGLIGAALGSILPWQTVPGILVWFSLLVAGLSMYKLASEWLAPRQALIAAVLFAANPYNVILIYYRGAFSELMAAALFPLLIWAVIGIAHREWSRAPTMVLVFAAIWLTNTPAGVIASYTTGLLLLVTCALRRDLRPLLPAALCVALAFGLAAFYVVPVFWEQRWIDLALLTAGDGSPERNFLFSVSNGRDFLAFNWIVSSVALCLMLLTAVAGALTWRRRRDRLEVWWVMIVLALVSSLLMFSVTKIVWRHVPKLQFLQFPWRWLIALAVAFALLVAAATVVKPKAFWLVGIFICAAALALSVKVKWGGGDVAVVSERFASGAGYFSTTNFTPVGANRFALEEHAPLLRKVDEKGELVELDDARVEFHRWSAERKIFRVAANQRVTLAIKLLNYPAWEVSIDGQHARVELFAKNGQMLITVPEGEHEVDLRFRRTRDRTIGGLISAGSVIVLLIIAGALWRRRRSGKLTTAAAA